MNASWAFETPAWFWALLIVPLISLLRRRRRVPVLVVPFAAQWHRAAPVPGFSWPVAAAYLGVILLIVALARPQAVEQKRETKQQGYDIMLAIDLSGSMQAEDYTVAGRQSNRLQAVKPVLEAFIERRPNDRIGVVVFSAQAYTFSPLTFDHDWLRKQTDRLDIGLIDQRSTAIGDGLGVALTRLEQGRRDSAAGSEGAFLILLTDGSNNAGTLDPREAAKIAAGRGVTIYTIGAGREGEVPMPVFDDRGNKLGYRRMRSDLDVPLLRDIADATNGRFFRADDSSAISEAFAAIDEAKKIEFEAQSLRVTDELFTFVALPAVLFLSLAAFGSVLRRQEAALA